MTLQLVMPGSPAPLSASDSMWFTPCDLATRMANWAGCSSMRVLEPSAGGGALAKALRTRGAHVACIERDPGLAASLRADGFPTACGDFLSVEPKPFDLVVINPPYENNADVEHVLHSLEFAPRVIALVRLNFLTGQARRKLLWSKHQPGRIAFLSGRPRFSGEVNGSPKHDFVVVDINRGLVDAVAELEWWA